MSSDPRYFDKKRGEINELKLLLQSAKTHKNVDTKREVLRKVIAYMTLGYDVSSLFSEIVMICSTRDLISKKMCYLYLSKYANSNPELTTLVINTMTTDCKDPDPMVRGLALRSLSSLGLLSVVEYIKQAILNSFKDSSGYVRRNGVISILKIYKLDTGLRSKITPYLLPHLLPRRSRFRPLRNPSRGRQDLLWPRRTLLPPYLLQRTNGRRLSWRT